MLLNSAPIIKPSQALKVRRSTGISLHCHRLPAEQDLTLVLQSFQSTLRCLNFSVVLLHTGCDITQEGVKAGLCQSAFTRQFLPGFDMIKVTQVLVKRGVGLLHKRSAIFQSTLFAQLHAFLDQFLTCPIRFLNNAQEVLWELAIILKCL